MLLGMCMAEPYGPEATEKYAADPDSMSFNCYFLGGVDKFVMDGHTITGLDAQGQEVFSHTYKLLDEKNENGFIFYQSEDENSGEFTYFAFSPDTMETTYHLEFRYAEDLMIFKAGSRAIMPIGMPPRLRRIMIRQPWKMSLSFLLRKICLRQNKAHAHPVIPNGCA